MAPSPANQQDVQQWTPACLASLACRFAYQACFGAVALIRTVTASDRLKTLCQSGLSLREPFY